MNDKFKYYQVEYLVDTIVEMSIHKVILLTFSTFCITDHPGIRFVTLNNILQDTYVNFTMVWYTLSIEQVGNQIHLYIIWTVLKCKTMKMYCMIAFFREYNTPLTTTDGISCRLKVFESYLTSFGPLLDLFSRPYDVKSRHIGPSLEGYFSGYNFYQISFA